MSGNIFFILFWVGGVVTGMVGVGGVVGGNWGGWGGVFKQYINW